MNNHLDLTMLWELIHVGNLFSGNVENMRMYTFIYIYYCEKTFLVADFQEIAFASLLIGIS